MSTYILVNRNKKDKGWWNDLICACVRIGDPFELHCWYEKRMESIRPYSLATKSRPRGMAAP